MYCTSCGAPNPDASAFCMHCGTRLAAPTTAPLAPGAAPASASLVAPRARRRWPLIAGGLVALLALLAVGIVLVQRGQQTAFTPRLIIAPPEESGDQVVVVNLDGQQLPLDLATSQLVDEVNDLEIFESAGGDFGAAISFLGARQRESQRLPGYVWRAGRYAVLGENQSDGATLVRFDLSTGKPLELLSGQQSSVLVTKADENAFVVLSGPGEPTDVYVGDIEQGTLTALTPEASAAFGWPGADWRHIAYAVQDGDAAPTFAVARMDGKDVHPIPLAGVQKDPIDAMPTTDNGQRVFYTDENRLYRVDAADGKPQRLASLPEGNCIILEVHHDTEQLLMLTDSNNRLLLVRADGSGYETLASGVSSIRDASFSPDGRQILVWSRDNDADQLVVFDRHGKNPREVFRADFALSVRWLADNSLLYATRDADNAWTIYREDAAGKPAATIARALEGLTHVAYAPDGHVAYAARVDGQAVVGIVQLPNGKPETIQTGDLGISRLHLAPGGRAVYQASDAGGPAVYLAEPASQAPTLLADGSLIATNLYH